MREIAKHSFKTVLSTGQHGWGSQSAMFIAAQGAIMYFECHRQMAYNPLCAEQMANGFKDPIGQIAFGSFIVANKFTSDMIQRKYGGISTSTASFMRTAMPYLGMSAGMLASNLSAEVLNMMVICAKTLIAGFSQEAKMMKMMGQAGEDPCNAAQKEFFNFNNKVEQYIPMMISMGSSTWLLTAGMKAYQYGKMGAQRLTGSKFGQKVGSTALMQALSVSTQPVVRVTGWFLALRAVPAGFLVLNAMTVGQVAFNVVQNWGFLDLDHAFIPFLNKAVGQFWRARLIKSSDEYLQQIFELNQQSQWNTSVNYQMLTKAGKIRSQEKTGSIIVALKAFREQMEAWRMINHSKVFVPLQAWSDITLRMIKEMNAAELFYGFYFSKIFDYYKYAAKAQTPEGLDGDEARKNAKIIFRKYPLNGVNMLGHAECENDVPSDSCITTLEFYMYFPDDMEVFQKRFLNELVKQTYEVVFPQLKADTIKPEALVKIKKLLADLTSTEVNHSTPAFKAETIRIGKALDKMNQYIANDGEDKLNDDNGRKFLFVIRKKIGNPRPSWSPGGLTPSFFEATVKELKIFDDLQVPNGSRYNAKTFTQHLIYQMMCGPEQSESNKIIKSSDGWMPEFWPPRVINHPKNGMLTVQLPDSVKVKDSRATLYTSLCMPNANDLTFDDLYRSTIHEPGKVEGSPVFYFLGKNLRTEIIGDWTNTNRDSTSGFYDWWNYTTKSGMVRLFERIDKEFQKLLVGLTDAINNEKFSDSAGWFDWVTKKVLGYETVIDPNGDIKWTHARRALAKSHIQEINTYLTVLAELEKAQDLKTYPSKKTQLMKDISFLEQMTVPVYAQVPSQKPLIKEMGDLIKVVEGIRVVDNRAKLPISMEEYNKIHDAMIRAFGTYKKHLSQVKFTPYQKQAADLAINSMEKSAITLSVYVFNTELTNFSMTQDYKTYLRNAERIKEINKDQKTIKQKTSPTGT